jgi:predicted branched-subunit amino acid permease
MDTETRQRGPAAEGALAMAPMLLAYVPFALVVGTAVARSEHPVAAWLGTSTIYGGAAHLAVLDVLAGGAGWLPAAAIGLLVNARLVAYAAALAPGWRTAPLGQRLGAAVMLTDAPWALSRRRPGDRAFYLGCAATLFVGWPAMVTVGMLLGDRIATAPVTGLLPALTLGGLLVSRLHAGPVALAAAAAAVAAVVTAGSPAGLALPVCAAVGTAAALVGRRS